MERSCCVIVGAGPGLGLALARRFAKGGFDIALISRNQAKLDDLTRTLNSEGCAARGFAADAAREQELLSAFSRIAEWHRGIKVLIYNAAAMVSDNVLDMTPGLMMEQMAPNFGGAICSVNQVLPHMRKHGEGTILITGGGLGIEPYPDWASLSAGKAALRSYGLALHKTLYPKGIHAAVIAVCGIVEAGGPFDPDRIAQAYWQLHAEPRPQWRRELVYLPHGADPYYNDASGDFRSTSLPLTPRGDTGS